MDRLVHPAMTAMRGAMGRQTASANKPANANTTGFRGEIANASTAWLNGPGFDSRAQQTEQVVAADMASGSVTQTGNPLDVAMNDDALLAVQAPDGDEAYTRRGDLTINESGLLTIGGGDPVLGQGGPITLPRSEEHTSELQSLMRISYAVFCLKKKNNKKNNTRDTHTITEQ